MDDDRDLRSHAAELRERAERWRELAKQYHGDVVDPILEFAAELEGRAAAMDKTVKPDGGDQPQRPNCGSLRALPSATRR